jgi:FtsH-binding integral membrane protein
MATRRSDGKFAGIGVGGILVIIGLILLFTGHTALGIVIALIGLVAFGGFAKGKWY